MPAGWIKAPDQTVTMRQTDAATEHRGGGVGGAQQRLTPVSLLRESSPTTGAAPAAAAVPPASRGSEFSRYPSSTGLSQPQRRSAGTSLSGSSSTTRFAQQLAGCDCASRAWQQGGRAVSTAGCAAELQQQFPAVRASRLQQQLERIAPGPAGRPEIPSAYTASSQPHTPRRTLLAGTAICRIQRNMVLSPGPGRIENNPVAASRAMESRNSLRHGKLREAFWLEKPDCGRYDRRCSANDVTNNL